MSSRTTDLPQAVWRGGRRTCEPACGAGARSTCTACSAKEREVRIGGCTCHAAPRLHERPDLGFRPRARF